MSNETKSYQMAWTKNGFERVSPIKTTKTMDMDEDQIQDRLHEALEIIESE